MKYSEMNKEQKQYLLLGVMAVVTTFFVLQNLVLGPLGERAEAAEKTIETLEPKLRRGQAMLQRDRVNREEMQAMSAEILEISQSKLPDRESQLSWAQRVLNELIKDQLELDGDAERVHPAQRAARPRGSYEEVKNRVPMWTVFAVDVRLRAGFEDVRRFLEALHEQQPYASVGFMRLATNPAHPEKHLVELVVEWPVFRFGQDLELLTTHAGERP